MYSGADLDPRVELTEEQDEELINLMGSIDPKDCLGETDLHNLGRIFPLGMTTYTVCFPEDVYLYVCNSMIRMSTIVSDVMYKDNVGMAAWLAKTLQPAIQAHYNEAVH